MMPPKAYRFIFLNAVRALSLIFLLLVLSSNIVTMVNDINAVKGHSQTNSLAVNGTSCDYIEGSTVPNQAAGPFWAVLNRLFILFQCIILIASEIGWPEAFFARFFPVLGRDFGIGVIGTMQCLLGAAILSHHVDGFTMVSAFLLFSIGILNIILALIFGSEVKAHRCILSWRNKAPELPTIAKSASSSFSEKGHRTNTDGSHDNLAGYGFGRQGFDKNGMKGFLISKPIESLPKYTPSNSINSRVSSPAIGGRRL